MSALKKPVSALIGVVAMLLAGVFFAVSPATASVPATAPVAVAAPHAAPGYGGQTITITITSTKNANGTTTYTLTISGFQGGEIVIIFIHSKPVELGSTRADSSGTINTSVTVPASFSGAHTLEAVGQTSGVVASTPIQLGSSTGTGTGSTGSGSGLSSTGVAVVGIGALGVVLLAGGGLLLIVGRRRKIGEI